MYCVYVIILVPFFSVLFLFLFLFYPITALIEKNSFRPHPFPVNFDTLLDLYVWRQTLHSLYSFYKRTVISTNSPHEHVLPLQLCAGFLWTAVPSCARPDEMTLFCLFVFFLLFVHIHSPFDTLLDLYVWRQALHSLAFTKGSWFPLITKRPFESTRSLARRHVQRSGAMAAGCIALCLVVLQSRPYIYVHMISYLAVGSSIVGSHTWSASHGTQVLSQLGTFGLFWQRSKLFGRPAGRLGSPIVSDTPCDVGLSFADSRISARRNSLLVGAVQFRNHSPYGLVSGSCYIVTCCAFIYWLSQIKHLFLRSHEAL